MKKLLCLLLALAALCAPALAEIDLGEFSTTDMEGHPVTQEIFADYDLTVVNVWATWCVYCVQEMPCFSKLVTMLPENVNFITLCTDASAEGALAEKILRESGANYQTLVMNSELFERIGAEVSGLPTTLFLDREGKSVAEPVVGALTGEDPAETYRAVIAGVLGMMEG